MRETTADIKWLSDPLTFKVNAESAHSDHKFFQSKEEADSGEMSLKESLCGEWKFSYAPHIKDRIEDFYKMDFNDEDFGTIPVPSSIQANGYGIPQYVNSNYPWDGHSQIQPPQISIDEKDEVGSYIKYFTVPENMKNKRIYVSFQGVENAFYVWLNGKFLGYSEDSFTPAEFEITEFLTDGENKLAVEVHKASTGAWLEDQDFWRLSGIFREVYIYAVPEIHVRDMFVKSYFSDNYKKADVFVELDFTKEFEDEAKVYAEFTDKEGNVLQSEKVSVKTEETVLNMKINEPHLWSGEEPYLYDLRIYVYKNDELVEITTSKFGFREFKMEDGIMKLNGKRIVFKGVNRHEFSCHTLRTVSEEEMLWDIIFMKQNNINAVRTSHYPNMTRWYELCDEYGIYLIDETNLETHGTWTYGTERDLNAVPGDKPEWLFIVLDRAKSMFMRDKNHSSILIWSCGNEAYGGLNIYKMSEYFRKSDNTRLVHYEGVVNDRTYNDTSDMESRMYATTDMIRDYLESCPDKPFVSCEYSHAMGNSCGALSWYTDLEDQYEQYQGGFIWDFIDQAVLKKDIYGNDVLAYGGDFMDRPTDYNFCVNGLIFGDRTTSPKMQEVKHLFSNIVIKPNKAGVSIKNNNLFTNTDYLLFKYTVELDGKLFDEGGFLADVKPGEEMLKSLPFKPQSDEGEYVITITAVLKEDCIWADKGHEVVSEQYTYINNMRKNEKILNQLKSEKAEYGIADGRGHLGVNGKNFKVIFNKGTGAIISYNINGVEYMAKPAYPDFSRAMTDNDRGCGFDSELIAYECASRVRKCESFVYKVESGHVKIYVKYKLATPLDTYTNICYTIFENGKVLFDVSYTGCEGMPVMPQFGMTFATFREYSDIKYYGMGPMENYRDRNKGAMVHVYETDADSCLTPYIIPQECGNRTNVRWISVYNQNKQGISIMSVDGNFEATVLPYSSADLSNALHMEELAKPYYTYITISASKMGVGGDNSWGARPHDEYCISGEKDYHYSFIMMPLTDL